MIIYKAPDDGPIEELGPYDPRQFEVLLRGAVSSLDSGSYGMGVSRSDRDFLEIRPVGGSEFLVWSDVLVSPKRLFGFPFRKPYVEKVVVGIEEAMEAAQFYADHSREEFERRYS